MENLHQHVIMLAAQLALLTSVNTLRKTDDWPLQMIEEVGMLQESHSRSSWLPWQHEKNSFHPTSCCGDVAEFLSNQTIKKKLKEFALAFGDGNGTCCLIESGMKRDKGVQAFSASKWVTGYLIMVLIQQGFFTLDTPVTDLLDWWSRDKNDVRSQVTVQHLLSQTDGMDSFGGGYDGLAKCKATVYTVVECAKVAHDTAFHRKLQPGTSFTYSNTGFYVLGAIAINVTKSGNYSAAFRKLIGDPLGLSSKSYFGFHWFFHTLLGQTYMKAMDPAGALHTTLDDFVQFIQAVFAKSLVSDRLVSQAEQPQTLRIKNMGATTAEGANMPTSEPFPISMTGSNLPKKTLWHYGFGSWLECESQECLQPRVSSIGAAGFYPWVQRHGIAPHWGVLSRFEVKVWHLDIIVDGLLPRVSAAVQSFHANKQAQHQNH